MRRLIVLFPFILIGLAATAQEGLRIGLRFSPIVSFANITDSTGASVGGDLNSRLGLSYGLSVNYGFLDNVGLHTGIHIVNKGYTRTSDVEVSPSITIDNATEKVRVTAVQVPVALRGRTDDIGGGFHIVGTFGITLDVSAGYRNRWTEIDPSTYETGESGELNRASNYLFPVATSFIFGAGVDWEIDRVGTVNLGITYHQGLTNVNARRGRFDEGTRGASENIKLNYVSLDASFYFGG